MKRSTDNRRSPAEIKIDLQKHYGGLEDHAPDPQAAERFHRKPYKLPPKKSTEARKDKRYDSKRSIRR